MSGRPNVEQIGQLREKASRVYVLNQTITRLRKEIAEATAELESAEREQLDSEKTILKLLHVMDVGPDGNAGSSFRVMAFLTELVAQSEHYGRLNP